MRNFRIEASTCLWWAVLLMILPLRWLMGAFLAATLHEFCHFLAIRAVGGRVSGITASPLGAVMETGPLEPGRELLCALAGPLGGLLPVVMGRFLPVTALFALVQSLFNLLPVYPLDGGRALHCAVRILMPHHDADRICSRIGECCIFTLMGASLAAARRFSLGFGAILPALLLLWRFFPGKRPCKTGRLALQ